MRERIPLPKGVPKTLRFQSIAFDVTALGDGRLAIAYYDGSRRIVVKRRTIEELKAEAERVAVAILNADTAALDMNADERRIYVSARGILSPLDLAVDAGARILAESAKLVGGPQRIVEACRWYSRQRHELRGTTAAEVSAHFIRNLRADALSAVYVDGMEDDLARFISRFPEALSIRQASEMADWLIQLFPGQRRRRNMRDKLVALFNFARDNNYLPEGLLTEAEKVKRPKVLRKAPAIYSPEEVELFITQCSQLADIKIGRKDYGDFIPPVTIAAFAGLRWTEILNLDWSDIHWEDRVIEVGDENKTGFRKVPIQPNLMAWLAPYRTRTGPVCLFKRPDHIIRRIGSRAGLKVGGRRYANAFRHSYVTYRVAVTKDMPLVSTESGHSVPELRKSYNRSSLETVGKKYFAITRDANNVLQMPLLSMRA